jgi:predicted nucleic-acid-binding Zn-ribbon protein
MICNKCGESTLGLIIVTKGGSRILSVGDRHSRTIWCRGCGSARIDQLNARDRGKAVA